MVIVTNERVNNQRSREPEGQPPSGRSFVLVVGVSIKFYWIFVKRSIPVTP